VGGTSGLLYSTAASTPTAPGSALAAAPVFVLDLHALLEL
jgi:hypothetical protein